jgi:NAD/NADP transhydrogenase alpha subunit
VQSLGAKFIELPMEEERRGAGGYAKAMGEDFLAASARSSPATSPPPTW